MAEDGRVEDDPVFKNGFILAAFDGNSLFIPEELAEVPEAAQWEEMSRIPAANATTRETYAALFNLYTGFIREGEVRKIVLARTADEEVTPEFSPYRAFEAACAAQPAAFKALVHTPKYGTWLFCTPEQLVTGQGDRWSTMALAGTRIPCTLPNSYPQQAQISYELLGSNCSLSKPHIGQINFLFLIIIPLN